MNYKIVLQSKLFKIISGTFAIRILTVGISFLSSVLLARFLGVEGFGVYSYVFALVSLLALPTQAGLPTLILRETAKAHKLCDWSIMKGIWLWGGVITALLSTAIFFIAIVFQRYLFTDIPGGTSLFILGLILSLLVAMGNVRGAALRGLGHVIKGQLPENLLRPLFLIVFLASAYLINYSINPIAVMSMHLIAAAMAFLIGAWLLFNVKPIELKSVKPIVKNKIWFLSIIPLAIMSGIQSINGQIDILMLGALSSLKDVGVYKVVLSGAALTLFGLQAVNTALTPRIAGSFAENNLLDLQKIASIGSLISFAFTIPMVLVLYFWGAEILAIFFGKEFIVGYNALLIICLGQMVNAFFGSSITLLTMSSNEKFVIQGMFLSAIMNTILDFLLIPQMGVNGAAISVACSLVIWNVYLWFQIKRNIDIDSTFIWLLLRKFK